jgi:hypothetical protein
MGEIGITIVGEKLWICLDGQSIIRLRPSFPGEEERILKAMEINKEKRRKLCI